MSLWDAIGDTLVRAFSEGSVTIHDRADPGGAPKTVRASIVPQREGEDLGLEAGEQLVQLSGAALGSLDMDGAKTLTVGGKRYGFRPVTGIGIRDPGDAAADNAPITRGIISTGGR